MKLDYLILNLIFSVFICQSIFGQEVSYVSSPVVKKDEILTDFIKDKYNENKKEVCDDCTYKQKQIITEILFKRKIRTLLMIEKGNLILSGPLYDFVNSVYSKIANANPQIPTKKIIILKDETANAFTMGEDIIYVHLGLLYRLQNEDQLAYILCHELGHDAMDHYYKDLINYSREKTDKTREQKIKEIMRKKYGHVSNLNEFLVPKLLVEMQESRTDESAADSLGVLLFQNTQFDKSNACTSFDVFLESDHVRDTLELDLNKLLHLNSNLIDESKLTDYSNESSLGDFEEGISQEEIDERNKLNDLLRSHPFEEERSEKIYSYFNLKIPSKFSTSIDPDYIKYRYLAEGEMISIAFQNQEIGKALFYSMNMVRNYPLDSYSKEALSLSMLTLYYYKKSFREGVAIENQDEENDIAYDKLIFFLKKISPDECYKIGLNLNNRLENQSNTLESKIIKLLIFHKEFKNDDFKLLYSMIEEQLKSSVYGDFVNTMNLEVIKRVNK